ncbi:sensor histidine kinase [Actinokineospora guangxiensis]|uniref:sensor histidine kinase n=1 Tax=Actinokineospora guangxiensis TaxID=1490288 RepID=UPI00366CEA81
MTGAAGVAGEASPSGELRRAPLLAPVVARAIMLVAVGAFCVIALIWVIYAGTPLWACVQAGFYLAAIFGLQVYFGRPQTQVRAPVTYAVLAAQAFLILVPLTQFGISWTGMHVLLAANAVQVFPPRIGWPLLALISAAMVPVQLLLGATTADIGEVLIGSVVGGLEFYGLTRLARLITVVHAARAELGEAAVAKERIRFAGDLHELLGLSLSTVGPKAVSAKEAVKTDPARAKEEVGEILKVARHALADVRLVASGYREASFKDESRTVESMLIDSDIEVEVEGSHSDLPVHVRTVVVAVLRAGAAEVLQREGVTRCGITMRQSAGTVELDITDDGEVGDSTAALPTAATDTAATLIDRVEALGGSLSRTVRPGGGNLLHLVVPPGTTTESDSLRGGGDDPAEVSATVSTWVMRTVFIGFAVSVMYTNLVRGRDVETLLTIGGFVIASLIVQLGYISRPGLELSPRMRYAVLGLMAVLVFGPLPLLGSLWHSIPGFLAGSALLLLRPAAGWFVFVAVLVTVPAIKAVNLVHPLLVVQFAGSTLITGLVVFGLTWMARAVHQLRSARFELARIAVAEERMRFARDLHDLLGLSLSAITLKAELALRLMDVDPDRAGHELVEIGDIARLALADVRLVASGYQELSLNDESRSAESVLVAADVDVRLNMHYGELPPEVRTVLATVLREGVTNVLRHSAKGARCEITVRQVDRMVMLEIVNNGAERVAAPSVGGSGLRNLSARVAELGGELTAGMSVDGTFRLSARVPA